MTRQAQAFIDRARSRLQDARSALEVSRLDVSVSNSAESIEFFAKATFLLLGREYPTTHEFKDEDVAALFERIPEQVRYFNFPRLFVLHELWNKFHTISRYGKDHWAVPASDLFKTDEAKLAATHANEWHIAVINLQSELRSSH
jgi:HEPN domain-containing protein